MKDKTKKQLLMGGAAAIGAGIAAWGIRKAIKTYEVETTESLISLHKGSRVYQTAAGPVEASIFGEGPPVMVIHGAAGGYDQGAVRAEQFEGIKYISVSRPGYLRTPLDTGVTMAEQADAMAALMDTLGIEKAAFIGTSTGGLVSIHFALRYPERCWALVLASAVNAPLELKINALATFSPLVETDFLPWVFLHPETLLMINPVLRKQVAADPDKMETIRQLVHTVYPFTLRLSGIHNDATQIEATPELPLETIKTPTLVIHGDADDTVPFSQGIASATRIPNAKFLPIPGGTHYAILTHLEITRPVIMDFIREHTPK